MPGRHAAEALHSAVKVGGVDQDVRELKTVERPWIKYDPAECKLMKTVTQAR